MLGYQDDAALEHGLTSLISVVWQQGVIISLMSSADCIFCDSDDGMDEIIVLSSSAVSSEEP